MACRQGTCTCARDGQRQTEFQLANACGRLDDDRDKMLREHCGANVVTSQDPESEMFGALMKNLTLWSAIVAAIGAASAMVVWTWRRERVRDR